MDSHVRQCPDNLSNITDYQLPKSLDSQIDVVKCSVGVTAFLFVLPFVLFYFKRFPIGATGAVLFGATLTVLTQTIDQHEVYQVLGAPENTRTICLLLGMMILAQYFERELLAEKVLSKLLKENSTFAMYLLAVTGFDFVLSAILTNDVACVALTPIILQHWNRRKGPKSRSQLSVLLLGIATSANIGSSSTIFGNPQMALIASKTSQPLFDKSRLDMRRCIFYLWLPAILCFGVNYFFLLIYGWMLERIDGFRRKRKQGGNITTIKGFRNEGSGHNMESVTGAAPIVSYPVHQENNQQSVNHHTDQGTIRHNVPVVRSMSSVSSAIASHFGDRDQDNWTPSNSKVFQAILCLGLILIVVLFLVSNEKIHFDMGLVPMGVAIVAMLADSLLNTRPPIDRSEESGLVSPYHVFRHVHLVVWSEQNECPEIHLGSTARGPNYETRQNHFLLPRLLRLHSHLLQHIQQCPIDHYCPGTLNPLCQSIGTGPVFGLDSHTGRKSHLIRECCQFDSCSKSLDHNGISFRLFRILEIRFRDHSRLIGARNGCHLWPVASIGCFCVTLLP